MVKVEFMGKRYNVLEYYHNSLTDTLTMHCRQDKQIDGDSSYDFAKAYKERMNFMYGTSSHNYTCVMPRIKDVKFHDPATIVFWMDGSKTVVKCGEGDAYDPEKGLAMAIAKRALGNEGNYYNEIRKRTEGYSEEDSVK